MTSCQESDWGGVISTVVITSVLLLLPIPGDYFMPAWPSLRKGKGPSWYHRWLYYVVAFAEVYALVLLLLNFYYFRYVINWGFLDKAWAAVTLPSFALLCTFGALLGHEVIIFYESLMAAEFIMSGVKDEFKAISFTISLVLSLVVTALVRKFFGTQVFLGWAMYAANATLWTLSLYAISSGHPGTSQNPRPRNFYVLCDVANSSMLTVSSLEQKTLLLPTIAFGTGLRFMMTFIWRCATGPKDPKTIACDEEAAVTRRAEQVPLACPPPSAA